MLSGRIPTTGGPKAKGKSNGNIMNFFKRTESTNTNSGSVNEEEDSLFLGDSPVKMQTQGTTQTPTPPREHSYASTSPENHGESMLESPLARYNEELGPVKRRRIGERDGGSRSSSGSAQNTTRIQTGPFLDDSEDEGETVTKASPIKLGRPSAENVTDDDALPMANALASNDDTDEPAVPTLKHETTSVGELNEFDGIEDFIDDEFPPEGEEYLERRWMEEQAQFEMGLEEDDGQQSNDAVTLNEDSFHGGTNAIPEDAGSTSCPICGGETGGMTDQVRKPFQDSGQCSPLAANFHPCQRLS